MHPALAFFAGMMLGACIGVLVAAACVIAGSGANVDLGASADRDMP